jgi:tetratricopeptide (TPR) repeat protein
MHFQKNIKKRFILFFCICFIALNSFSQTDKKQMKESMLAYVSDLACNSIKKLDLKDKSYNIVNEAINDCIYKEVSFYRLTNILIEKDSFLLFMNDTTFRVDHILNAKIEENEFLDYYFEIKSYLLENCVSMRLNLYSNEEHHEHSLSKKKKALKWYYKAIELKNANKYDESIVLLKKVLKKDSIFAFAWDMLGLNYRKIGEFDKSIEAYEKSISIDPKGKFPWQNMAIAYEYKKDYIGAIICYKKLGELDIINPEVFYGIGRITAFYMNDNENALENICIALSLYNEANSPEKKDAMYIIGYIHDEMKKEGKEAEYDKILLKHFSKDSKK